MHKIEEIFFIIKNIYKGGNRFQVNYLICTALDEVNLNNTHNI